MGWRLSRSRLRVATLEEVAAYGGTLPRGLVPPIAGGSGLAIDTSTPPPVAFTADVSSTTTGTFSPPSGSVIVAFIAAESNSATNAPSVSSVTGGGLTLARITGAAVSGRAYPTNNYSVVEAWYASAPSGASGMSLTVTLSEISDNTSGPTGIIQPVVFTGAATTQSGAVATVSAGTPSASVTTTAAGSWVFAAASSDAGNTDPTVPSGQTLTINGNLAVEAGTNLNSVWWAQMQTAATAASGTAVSMSTTSPISYTNFLVVEILASGSVSLPGPARPIVGPSQAVWRSIR
ncbi:MAG: hypothetical protein ACYCQK_02045 [Acidiferrobacteraceae bacterium]